MKIQKVGPKAKRPQKNKNKNNITTHPMTMPQAAGKKPKYAIKVAQHFLMKTLGTCDDITQERRFSTDLKSFAKFRVHKSRPKISNFAQLI